MPLTLISPVHSELLIRKSRFLGCVQPVADRTAAQQVVARLWVEHPGATHVCWALLAGGQSAAVDDGEPSGTAGRPMLEVLRRQDLEGVLATVVRFYGGVPLGAGGLVRAYTDSVAQALTQADKVRLTRSWQVVCRVPYALEGLLRRELSAWDAPLLHMVHDEEVLATFSVVDARWPALQARLNEATHGRLVWVGPDPGTEGAQRVR